MDPHCLIPKRNLKGFWNGSTCLKTSTNTSKDGSSRTEKSFLSDLRHQMIFLTHLHFAWQHRVFLTKLNFFQQNQLTMKRDYPCRFVIQGFDSKIFCGINHDQEKPASSFPEKHGFLPDLLHQRGPVPIPWIQLPSGFPNGY